MWFKYAQKKEYIRFGDIPESFSWNHILQKPEKGISVYEAYYDPEINKYVIKTGSEQMINTLYEIVEENRPIFLVKGIDTGFTGDDGETLLKSIKIIKPISLNDVVTEDEPDITLDGTEIEF